jgi:hypothetical protein
MDAVADQIHGVMTNRQTENLTFMDADTHVHD